MEPNWKKAWMMLKCELSTATSQNGKKGCVPKVGFIPVIHTMKEVLVTMKRIEKELKQLASQQQEKGR